MTLFLSRIGAALSAMLRVEPSLAIKDEGEGFDFNNLPDPTAPENLEKPTGRGVFLMKNLSDLVVFSDNGSVVEIHFKL